MNLSQAYLKSLVSEGMFCIKGRPKSIYSILKNVASKVYFGTLVVSL